MIEINLLPWRDDIRLARIKKLQWLCFGFFCIGTLISVFFYFAVMESKAYRYKSNHGKTQYSHHMPTYNPFQKVQFAGYLRESNRLWGLLKLPSGEVREVQVGSRIDRLDATVKSMTEDTIVIVAKDHSEYILQGN